MSDMAKELEEERAKVLQLRAELAWKDQCIRYLEAEVRRLETERAGLESRGYGENKLLATPASQPLLDGAGSEASISDSVWDDCAVTFYDQLCSDPTVQRFFCGTKFSTLKQGQWCFFRSLWDGQNLEMDDHLHQIWDIKDRDFDRFLEIFKRVLVDHASESATESFLQRMEGFRSKVVSRVCHQITSPEPVRKEISLERQTHEELADHLKQLFLAEMEGDMDQVPPEKCLLQMARHLKEALHLGKHQRMSTSHLQPLHQNFYIPEMRFDRLRGALAADPALSNAAILQALDDTKSQVTNHRGTKAQASEERRIRGTSSLSSSVTILNTVNAWYEGMKEDDMLAPFFQRRSNSAAHVAKRQFDFIHRMALASKTFREETQQEHLRKIHRPLLITDSHFDRFVMRLMKCCKHNPQLQEDFVSFIEKFRRVVVQRWIAKHDDEVATCPVTGHNQAQGSCPFQSANF